MRELDFFGALDPMHLGRDGEQRCRLRRMIYRLDESYLERLESERNSRLFYAYAIAGVAGAVSVWQLGWRALPICVVALVAAGAFHWRLAGIHVRNLAVAGGIEVEVVGDRLVYRSAVGEQHIFLSQLRSVQQASKFEPIKLVLAEGPPLMLDGFRDADQLVGELSAHVNGAASRDS